MPNPQHIVIGFAVLNVAAFALFGIDKAFSKAAKQRISEKTLLIAAALLASPGAILGMVVFNHKTSKAKFRYGVPLLLVAHAALGYWLSFV